MKYGPKGELFFLGGDTFYSLHRYASSGWKPRRRYWKRTHCSSCDAVMYQDKSNAARGATPFCSLECKRAGMSGPNNANWGGGKKFKRGSRGGHVLVYMPDHPSAKKGFVPEHRLVVEEFLGRHLKDSEIVHHIDCDKQNNELQNLVVCQSNKQHFKAHGSLNGCVAALIRMGVLRFNKETFEYEVIHHV